MTKEQILKLLRQNNETLMFLKHESDFKDLIDSQIKINTLEIVILERENKPKEGFSFNIAIPTDSEMLQADVQQ